MIYTLTDFLNRDRCEAIRDLFPPSKQGRINTRRGTAPSPARRSRVSFFSNLNSETEKHLTSELAEVILRANEKFYRFEISSTQHPQLAEYGEGDGYDWHLDIGPGAAALRKLSMSVQLSDQNSYDGGDLEIWGSPPAPREQGSVTVFPAYMLHRVAPVTRGVRYSLVVWAAGAVPFR